MTSSVHPALSADSSLFFSCKNRTGQTLLKREYIYGLFSPTACQRELHLIGTVSPFFLALLKGKDFLSGSSERDGRR
jgi:hypothetical protein